MNTTDETCPDDSNHRLLCSYWQSSTRCEVEVHQFHVPYCRSVRLEQAFPEWTANILNISRVNRIWQRTAFSYVSVFNLSVPLVLVAGRQKPKLIMLWLNLPTNSKAGHFSTVVKLPKDSGLSILGASASNRLAFIDIHTGSITIFRLFGLLDKQCKLFHVLPAEYP